MILEWFICQVAMIYFPSWYDLFLIIFALPNQFIKTLGTNKKFWQAVPMMNHLNGSYHSQGHKGQGQG